MLPACPHCRSTKDPPDQTPSQGPVSIKGGPTSKSFKATSSNPAQSLRPRLNLGGGRGGGGEKG